MQPRPGNAFPAKHVCLLKKSLYGLKQAPQAWFDKFRTAILHANFSQIPNDSSLFIHQTPRGSTILLVYVNDTIISGNDTIGTKELKNHLMHTFQMKDLGPLTYFLGLAISRSNTGIRVDQRKYAKDLLSSTSLTDAKSFTTPSEINRNDGPPLANPSSYRRLVDSLLYLAMTRLSRRSNS